MLRPSLLVAALLCNLTGGEEHRGGPTTPPMCSLMMHTFLLTPGTTVLLGTFGSEMQTATRGPVRPSRGPGHVGRPGSDIRSQSLAVEQAHGAGVDRLDLEPPRRLEVQLVLWDYDAACRPTPYASDGYLGAPGTQVVVRARLRPRRDWVAGQPTFDSFGAGADIYPSEALPRVAAMVRRLREALPDGGTQPPDPLTASEVYRLAVALPAQCDHTRDRDGARARLERAKEDLEEYLERSPGDAMLIRQEYLTKHPRSALSCLLASWR